MNNYSNSGAHIRDTYHIRHMVKWEEGVDKNRSYRPASHYVISQPKQGVFVNGHFRVIGYIIIIIIIIIIVTLLHSSKYCVIIIIVGVVVFIVLFFEVDIFSELINILL